MFKVGVADTTFARVDMARYAIDAMRNELPRDLIVERFTVPGVKDLPLAAKQLVDGGCDIVIALGMPGATEIDKTCAHEASTGLINVQLATGKRIIEVFVHEDEAKDERDLFEVAVNRSTKHGVNVCRLLRGRGELARFAGMGLRQGRSDAGPLLTR